MANLVTDICKGRVGELHNRVQTNDPATSVILIVVIALGGLESDATLLTRTTLAQLLTAGTTREVTNTGYARVTLTDTVLPAFAPDYASHNVICDLPDQQWNNVGPGSTWAKLFTVFDINPGTTTDATRIPMTMHDFPVTPNNTNILATINGYFRAQ